MTNLRLDLFTSALKIRQLCIDERWYTNGTVNDYNKLLDYVDHHQCLDEEALEVIAMDLFTHSVGFDSSYPVLENLNKIKHIILNNAVDICRYYYGAVETDKYL